MHRITISLVLRAFAFVLLSGTAAAQDPSKVKNFPWRSVYQKPGFANVDTFVEKLRHREKPWGELLMPDDLPDYEMPEDFTDPDRTEVTVIYRTKGSAIVFAKNKPHRQAPFSALIFLLTKTGRHFHVTDFIRSATGYESYSDVNVPEMLKLQPREYPHFYFVNYFGGRKWDFGTAEFYLVKDRRFRRTLTLKNVDAYLSPAAPYRDFSQTAKVSVRDGRPLVQIGRQWSFDSGENASEDFSIVFHWNPHSQSFTSTNPRRITLLEPPSWSGEGLPKPPAKRSR